MARAEDHVEAQRSRDQRLGLACACTVAFASAANYTNHAPMVATLAAEFGFTLGAAGLLTTGVFLTHAAMQIPGGHIADRFGPKPVVAVALAVVCVGNVALGFAGGYGQLLLWKLFVGLGTGTCFVAGARYVATMFAGPHRHLAQGLYGGSVLLGSGFVIFVVPILLAAFDWRRAFFSTAALAAAAAMVWTLFTPKPPAVSRSPVPLAEMLANPQLWLLGLMQMGSFGLVLVIGTWVATYLSQSFHLTLVQAGRIGSLVLVLGIASRPLGGLTVARLGAKRTMQIGLALNVIACLVFSLGRGSLVQAAGGTLLLGIGGGLPYAGVFNRAAALYPARAGAAMGLVNMLGIVMILTGPPLVGQMVEWSKSFQSSFLALSAFTLLVLVCSAGIHQHESDAMH